MSTEYRIVLLVTVVDALVQSFFGLVIVSASLQIGNCLPIGVMPEGTIICNMEEKAGDKGKLARTSGNYATVVSHNPDTKKTRVKLPSGVKKVYNSANRAMIGIVAGGGRIDKPLLKAGRAYHKYKVKRNCWPRVRGVAMNVSRAVLGSLKNRILSQGSKTKKAWTLHLSN